MGHDNRTGNVSILVVLDGWVKGVLAQVMEIGMKGFNPCCVGWVGKSLSGLSFPISLTCFNPCCVGWVGKR